MNAYTRNQSIKIHVDWAARICTLHKQYLELIEDFPQNKKYESTLTLSLLNSLLCYGNDLINSRNFDFSGKIKLNEEEIIYFFNKNNLPSPINIFKCIRNAISHPLGTLNENSNFQVTGFDTYDASSPTGEKIIEGFIFTHSPYINNNGTIKTNIRNLNSEFNVIDRLKVLEGKFFLDDNELPNGPYLRLKISTPRLSEILQSLSEAFKFLSPR